MNPVLSIERFGAYEKDSAQKMVYKMIYMIKDEKIMTNRLKTEVKGHFKEEQRVFIVHFAALTSSLKHNTSFLHGFTWFPSLGSVKSEIGYPIQDQVYQDNFYYVNKCFII